MPELQEKIESRLAELAPEVELIAMERPGGDVLRLYIDHPDGVDLELCERVTGHLRSLLENHSLEVSSPGLDRPLTKLEHYRRFLGHRVRVRTRERLEGRRSFTGTLAEADERALQVEENGEALTIPLSEVQRSNLVPEPAEVPK